MIGAITAAVYLGRCFVSAILDVGSEAHAIEKATEFVALPSLFRSFSIPVLGPYMFLIIRPRVDKASDKCYTHLSSESF